ncbi:uncharacterized protein SPPG_03429 [Spizellomyces punctatus DAOM BR117]|uniref:Uncharacterized protein n=1 Tax=Spizellomyces punctatus (strain DAOM BR117) TaxID=645134 RepID=A0A0L0HKS8_SPIPD|nr:uncharacterized protein SPPG_03429 [Spizellomyces punctatus DAOM BR117]KND01633.1 hypothetical protein SPPG_03429 [Spizellomyces punctatus DAOM BR117]|eukprot:XP_016609672.1 hypothetical protein SPPG_03429 [Spizellomyces punctatus DAOM BR117]
MLSSPNPLDRPWRQEMYKQRSALQSKHPRLKLPINKEPKLPPIVISAAHVKYPPARHQKRPEWKGLTDLSGRRRVYVSRLCEKVTDGTQSVSRDQSMFDEQMGGTIREKRSPNPSDSNIAKKKQPISAKGRGKQRTSQKAHAKSVKGCQVVQRNTHNAGTKCGKKRKRKESREARKKRKKPKLDNKTDDTHSILQDMPPPCIKKPLIPHSDHEYRDVNTNTPPRNQPNKPTNNTQHTPDILSNAERFSDFDPFWIPDWMPPPHNEPELYTDDDVSEEDVLAMLHDPHDDQCHNETMRDDEKSEIVRNAVLNKRRYSRLDCVLAIDMTNPAVKTAEDVYKAISVTHDGCEPNREYSPEEIKMECCAESNMGVKLESRAVCGEMLDAKLVGLDGTMPDSDATVHSGVDKTWFDARQCADEFISNRDIPPKSVLIYILHVMVESMMRFRLIRRTRWNVSHIVASAARDGYGFSVDKLVQELQVVDQQDTWEKMTEYNNEKDRLWAEGYTAESREVDLVDWYDDRNDGDGPLKSQKLEDALNDMDEQWRRVCGKIIKDEKGKPPRPAEIASRSFYGSYGTKDQKRSSRSPEECARPVDSHTVKTDPSHYPMRIHKDGDGRYDSVQNVPSNSPQPTYYTKTVVFFPKRS